MSDEHRLVDADLEAQVRDNLLYGDGWWFERVTLADGTVEVRRVVPARTSGATPDE